MRLKTLLKRNRRDLALLIGNGVNRYGTSAKSPNSWDALLSSLARSHLDPGHTSIPPGISLIEFYDVLELASHSRPGGARLQQRFCELIAHWRALPQHGHIAGWATRNGTPLLTTNFENCLAEAVGATLRRTTSQGFTAYYPWTSYYGISALADASSGFGIWHVNGMQRYRQSIRLGLSHYMGSVERARILLHKGGRSLMSGAANDWNGSDCWLHAFMHKPLLIIGLGLTETEVFLRWLLIERARYHRAFPGQQKPGWYVHTTADENPGRRLFLRAVGIDCVAVPDYDELYGADTWSA